MSSNSSSVCTVFFSFSFGKKEAEGGGKREKEEKRRRDGVEGKKEKWRGKKRQGEEKRWRGEGKKKGPEGGDRGVGVKLRQVRYGMYCSQCEWNVRERKKGKSSERKHVTTGNSPHLSVLL